MSQISDLLDSHPLEQEVNPVTSISDRLSQELIIAMVGPIGSGVSTAAQLLRDMLTQDLGYAVAPIIRPSDIIKEESTRVGVTPPAKSQLSKYIDVMQTAGNKLREKFGANYLASKSVEKIVTFRREKGGYSDGDVPLPGRRAYIIDSLKNMEELELLRQIYRDTLCVIGVFAPDSIRKKRLLDNGADLKDVQTVIDRDQGEPATFGQMTREIFTESDFFVCNDQTEDELRQKLSRFLGIIFNTGIYTPSRSESAMYEANASASSSACMSRQVGAAILSQTGELIAVGWNDVPRYGGGLYTGDDQRVWDAASSKMQDRDYRCFKWDKNICHNEIRRKSIIDKVAVRVRDAKLLRRGKTIDDVLAVLAGTEVDALIEFSRSIHAEMEAILSVAREGRHSLVGATLYTSTYPCHNCARHIVASGIASVVYIQPYAKSLATALHYDSITENPEEKGKVVFRQYDGVAPRNFLKLFQPKAPRKRDGAVFSVNPCEALPVLRMPLDGSVEYESKVLAELAAREQTTEAIR